MYIFPNCFRLYKIKKQKAESTWENVFSWINISYWQCWNTDVRRILRKYHVLVIDNILSFSVEWDHTCTGDATFRIVQNVSKYNRCTLWRMIYIWRHTKSLIQMCSTQAAVSSANSTSISWIIWSWSFRSWNMASFALSSLL